MSEKIIGYILVFLGIILIIGAAVSVILVFTGQMQPVKVFDVSSLTSNESMQALGISGIGGSLDQTANITAHLFLMGFIASVGQKLAMIGTQLVRPIVVKLREEAMKQ